MIKMTLRKPGWNLGWLVSRGFGVLLLIFVVSITDARSQNATDVVQRVEARTSYEGDRIRQGSPFKIAVIFDLVYHYGSLNNPVINSNNPFDPNLIPTKLELINLNELDGLAFSTTRYPKGTRVKLEFSKQPLSAYFDHNRIEIDGRVAAKMPTGRYELKAKLTYQPCYESGCGASMFKIVTIPIEVVDPQTEVQWDNYYFHRFTKRDLFLIPLRLTKGIGGCMIKGCS